jgi:hypothetical protein
VLHFRRYIAALSLLLAAFGFYYVAVAPWIEPPQVKRGTLAASSPLRVSPQVQTDLSRLFAPGAWELDSKTKIVETEQCTLLIRDYQPMPDGRLELKPCTLIFYTKPESAETAAGPATASPEPPAPRRPIVMQAPAGAVLQFDRPLNIGRGDFGQIVGGRLVGEITIFSPPTQPQGDDSLRIITSDVQLGRDSLFTTEDVEFHYGKSSGRGRDLTIVFLRDAAKAGSSSKSPSFDGVQSITLSHIERLRIATGGGTSVAGPFGSALKPQQEGMLEVTCQGPFEFDFINQVAVFDKKVEVLRLVPGSAPDRLRCEQLLLEFVPKPPDEAETHEDAVPSLSSPAGDPPAEHGAQAAPAASPVKPSPAGRLQRVIAFGNPAVLESPSSAARAVACRMEYSLARQRIVLMPGKGSPQVSLRHQGKEFTARELEYEFAEAGRIGRLWAAGPGELRAEQDTQMPPQTFVARWQRELRIRPHAHNQVISLIGNASIGMEPKGRFDAAELHLWVQEIPPPAGAPQRSGKPQSTIVPDRLLATGKVSIHSQQLIAETRRLEVWFSNVQGPAAAAPAAVLPFGPQPQQAAAPGTQPPPTQQFRVLGDLIQMQLQIAGGKQVDLEDLTIRGQASIDETRTPEPGQEPIHVAGDLLELHHGTTPQATIEVTGHPAELAGRGMSLIGGTIHFRRGENRAWIDGPGEATLPVPADQAIALGPGAFASGGQPVREPAITRQNGPPKKLHVVWHDGLTFDGQTVHLEGEVVARSATQLVLAKTLEARLTQPIDFQATGGLGPAELGRLHLDGGVLIKNSSFDERGEMISYDQMQVKNLTLDRSAGRLNADGPGWVSTVRRSVNGAPGGQAIPLLSRPPAGANSGKPEENPLTSVHIQFERRIEGDLAKRRIEFQRNVRTTYSPASDFADIIMATSPDKLGERGVLMASDRLAVTEMLLSSQRWMELEASDNVLVEGRTFTVRAATVRYTSDKEILTIEGNGRIDAEIWHQAVPGEPRTYTSARKLRYWLRDGTFDGEDFNTLDLQQIGPKLNLRDKRR